MCWVPVALAHPAPSDTESPGAVPRSIRGLWSVAMSHPQPSNASFFKNDAALRFESFARAKDVAFITASRRSSTRMEYVRAVETAGQRPALSAPSSASTCAEDSMFALPIDIHSR